MIDHTIMSGLVKRFVQDCVPVCTTLVRSWKEPVVAKEQIGRILGLLQNQISEKKAHFLLRRKEERLNQILGVHNRDSYQVAYAALREDLQDLEKVDRELVQARAKYQHDTIEYREIIRQDNNRRSGKYRGEPQIDCQQEILNLQTELQSSREHFESVCEKRMEVDEALRQSLRRCARLPGSIYTSKHSIYTLFD